MARIVGVDLPKNKRGEIGLTYILGIGRSSAQKILDEAGVDRNIKVQDWNDDQINSILVVTGASATVSDFLPGDRAQKTMHVPVKEERKPSRIKRKQLNKSIRLWLKRQDRQRSVPLR